MKNYWLPIKEISTAKNLKVVGLLSSADFQNAKYLAEVLYSHDKLKYNKPKYRSLMEFDWLEYRYKLNKNIGGQAWALIKDVAVFWNDELLGNDNDLLNIIVESNLFIKNIPDPTTFIAWAKKAKEDYFNKDPDKAFVFFEISENDTIIGTFVFELYSDLLPETCDRFMHLCINHPLRHPSHTYTGSNLHRIAKSGWVQGGDLGWKNVNNFADECYAVDHDRRGILSLTNCGKDTNGTQFFINFNPAPWMNTYYVAIGHIVEGHSLLQRIENAKTYYESPCSNFVISNSGILPYGRGNTVRAAFLKETIKYLQNKFKFSIGQQDLNLIQNKLTTVSKFDILQEIRRTEISELSKIDSMAGTVVADVSDQLEKGEGIEGLIKDVLDKVLNDAFMLATIHKSPSAMLEDGNNWGLYSEPLLRASLQEKFLEVCYDTGFLERPSLETSETEIRSSDLSDKSDTTINYILSVIMNAVTDKCDLEQDRSYVYSIIDRLIDEVTDTADLSAYEAAVREKAKSFLRELFIAALENLMFQKSMSFDSVGTM